MSARGANTVFCFVAGLALLALSGCSKPRPVVLEGGTMGTSYSVVLPTLPNGIGEDAIRAGINALLQRTNQQMSTYIEDSELSLLNRNTTPEWIELSDDLAKVLEMSLEVSQKSAGAFDVTVGPLVNLWGFGPKGRIETRPPAADIARAKAQCGYEKIELENGRIRKNEQKLYIDLSAIAKGYGVDVLADYLESQGVGSYLVEIGGEVRAKGQSIRGDKWRIAVEKPVAGQRSVDRVVYLSDIAVATSGDYRNFFVEDGRRYSHTIDPRSGQPISHKLASVTVMHSSTAMADAWATALMVLGEKDGYELAQQLKLPAYFLVREGGSYLSRETQGFARFTTATD